jgi:hypothetical protein
MMKNEKVEWKNTGSANLKISDAKGFNGCLVVSYPSEHLKPAKQVKYRLL